MTKYYSNNPDFNSTVEAGSTNGGYITPTSYNSARSEVVDALSNIDKVTNVIRDEHLSYLYVPEGTVKFGQEMPESTFTSSYDTVDRMLDLAKRIHREVLERIDNKFTKGVDASIQSLNSVNGSDNPYKTSHLSYTATHQTAENGYYYEYETTEFYTLAELLNYKKSPIEATQNYYLQRVNEFREQLDSLNNSNLHNFDMDEGGMLNVKGGPDSYKYMTDDEIISHYFNYKQIGNYSGLKYFQWQEDNKAWLEPLEPYLGIALLAVTVIATAVSMGVASPTVAAAAGVAATTAAVAGAAEEGYEAATGHSLISGTQLSTDDRMWAAAGAVGSVATLGLGKIVKLAGVTDDIINAVNKTTNAIDDGIALSHIGYDTVVNGKNPSLSLLSFAFGKGAALASQHSGANLSNTSTSRSNNTNIDVLTKSNDLSPSKINDLELEYKNYVAKKLDSESEPLSMSEWVKKRDISKQNFSTYEAFSANRIEEFKINNNDVETNITVKTRNADGEIQRVKLKAVGFDESGNIRIQDYTTAKNGISKERQEILDNLSKYGGEVVGAGKGKFAGGTEIPQGTRIDVINGSSQFSPEWQTYLSEFPKADLSSAQIKSITAIKPDPENGILRPKPEVYLSKEYLEQHEQLFDGGVAAFVKSDEFIEKFGTFGRPDGAFVFPRHVAEAMIKEADGDPRKLEDLLGLDHGSLGDSPKMVLPQEVHNYRIPDGNEGGSRENPLWRPGGKTYPGGVPEAVIDPVPKDKVKLEDVFKNQGDKNGNNSRK